MEIYCLRRSRNWTVKKKKKLESDLTMRLRIDELYMGLEPAEKLCEVRRAMVTHSGPVTGFAIFAVGISCR